MFLLILSSLELTSEQLRICLLISLRPTDALLNSAFPRLAVQESLKGFRVWHDIGLKLEGVACTV